MNTQIRVSMRGVSEQAFGSRCADGLYRDFVTHPAATQATLQPAPTKPKRKLYI